MSTFQPGVLGLILLRQLLNASARLWSILARSQPARGWPILRAFVDVCERISRDAHPRTVAPALARLLDAIEGRCPGVTDAVLRSRDSGRRRDSGCVEPSPEEAE